LYFEHTLAQLEYGYIESTATKVKHSNVMVFATFVQSVGQCCSGRLIYDAAHGQTSNFSGFLCGLALSVIEICRHGNHGLFYFLAQVIFSDLLHFLKNHGADFLGGIQSSVYVNSYRIIVTFDHFITPVADLFSHLIMATAHETFYTHNRIMRICNSLPLSRVSYLPLPIFQESHYRWR